MTDMTHDVPFEGIPFNIGGREYIVPGLPWAWLEANSRKMEQVTKKPFKEQIGFIFEVCHTALKRNYPDITVQQLKEDLDIPTMNRLVQVVMGASGLSQGEPVPGGSLSASGI